MGQSVRLSAVLGDAAGNVLPQRKAPPGGGSSPSIVTIADRTGRSGIAVAWSATPGLTRIDERGVITALATGSATVTAAAGGLSGNATINIIPADPAPFMVTPSRARIAVGDSLQLTAIGKDSSDGASPLPVAWSSTNNTVAIVNESGVVAGIAAGTATIQATSGPNAFSVAVEVAHSPEIQGLDFPGSAATNETMRFEFKTPMRPYPATYIWRAYPRQQGSYYTAFFWGNGGDFYPKNTYYGFHPYPDWQSTSSHFWEIAAPPGSDIVSPEKVIYDRWYLQVVICQEIDGQRVEEFYWDWPDTSKVLRHESAPFPDPPSPVLVVGDAPWNPGQEIWDGVLRGFQFYDTALSLEDVRREVAAPASARTPWYLNVDPTPADIADKSGNGNHPEWVAPMRPLLWSGTLRAGKTIVQR